MVLLRSESDACQARNMKTKGSQAGLEKKRLFVYYDSELLKKECPCIHKTSTPVRADFDLYEDIVFLSAKHLDSQQKPSDEAFIKDPTYSNENNCRVFPKTIKKTFKKAKRNSKKGAAAALTLILCNIL